MAMLLLIQLLPLLLLFPLLQYASASTSSPLSSSSSVPKSFLTTNPRPSCPNWKIHPYNEKRHKQQVLNLLFVAMEPVLLNVFNEGGPDSVFYLPSWKECLEVRRDDCYKWISDDLSLSDSHTFVALGSKSNNNRWRPNKKMIVGVVTVSLQYRDDQIAQIAYLATHPDYQRSGVATQLLNHVQQWVKTLGRKPDGHQHEEDDISINQLVLQTGAGVGFAPARAFYQKQGFFVHSYGSSGSPVYYFLYLQ